MGRSMALHVYERDTQHLHLQVKENQTTTFNFKEKRNPTMFPEGTANLGATTLFMDLLPCQGNNLGVSQFFCVSSPGAFRTLLQFCPGERGVVQRSAAANSRHPARRPKRSPVLGAAEASSTFELSAQTSRSSRGWLPLGTTGAAVS